MSEQRHGGWHAIDAALDAGASTLFTLSGAHIFPLYDAAVEGNTGSRMRLVDVRHEATAVFAAEATARLTRTPGFAAVTAGPGVTNAVTAITSARFNSAPVVLIGGRSPAFRWGTGALQEMDHVPLLESITKSAVTAASPESIGPAVAEAFRVALTPRRGPAFVDVPMDVFYTPSPYPGPAAARVPVAVEPVGLDQAVAELSRSERPVLVLGSGVYAAGAEVAARELAESLRIPVIANGMGRGVIPGSSPLLVNRARGKALGALGEADLVIVVGTELDFRLNYGSFGTARVVHVVESAEQVAAHATLAATVVGDLGAALAGLAGARVTDPEWAEALAAAVAEAKAGDTVLGSDETPLHPARVFGELLPRLTPETTVIGDGGDFVSFAGKYVEPELPGRWLDPGPFGALGTGLGYALATKVARPDDPAVLLLGDGAAGFSLMDAETLVRHGLPVVIVVGNNSAWGLEKHPMRLLHGYDVLADLGHETSYDGVVEALGGSGETVRTGTELGPALDRAFESGKPYLVNVLTDPEKPYPRSTTGL